MAVQDHYHTLGIPVNASSETIRMAYRKWVLLLHPDRTGGDERQTARFLRVKEAYDVLSDPGRKKAYDMERYFSGLHTVKKPEGLTVKWLEEKIRELNRHVVLLDAGRIHLRPLQEYLIYLLAADHLDLLKEEDPRLREVLFHLLLPVAEKLRYPAVEPVALSLQILAKEVPGADIKIARMLQKKIGQARFERYLPFVLGLVALLLCLLMYRYQSHQG